MLKVETVWEKKGKQFVDMSYKETKQRNRLAQTNLVDFSRWSVFFFVILDQNYLLFYVLV